MLIKIASNPGMVTAKKELFLWINPSIYQKTVIRN